MNSGKTSESRFGSSILYEPVTFVAFPLVDYLPTYRDLWVSIFQWRCFCFSADILSDEQGFDTLTNMGAVEQPEPSSSNSTLRTVHPPWARTLTASPRYAISLQLYRQLWQSINILDYWLRFSRTLLSSLLPTSNELTQDPPRSSPVNEL